jgi:hypothetical protein
MTIGKEAVIVRVFSYDAEVVSSILLPDDQNDAYKNDLNIRTLPLAWVVAAGSEAMFNGVKIERGHIMRLWDWKTKSLENPKYRAYFENSDSQGNGQIQGVAPPKLVHRIYRYYAENVVFIDPTKTPDLDDYFTFAIDAFDFMGHITNPEILIKNVK